MAKPYLKPKISLLLRVPMTIVLLTAIFGCAAASPPPEPAADDLGHVTDPLMATEPTQGARAEGEVLGKCVNGTVNRVAIDSTSVDMSIIGSHDESASRVGITSGLSVRTGFAKGQARATFARSTVESDTAFSVVVEVEHEAYQLVLDTIRGLTALVGPSSPRFTSLCGDGGVVSSVTYGGRLIMNVRFSFASAAEKSEFHGALTASIGRGGKGVDLSSELEKLTQSWSGKVALSVSAFQDGGGSENLGRLFLGAGDSVTAADNTVNCSQAEIGACIRLVRDALVYFDTPDVVASFKAAPAPIAFDVTPWHSLNLPVTVDVPPEAFLARRKLELLWDDVLAVLDRLGTQRTFGAEDPDLYRKARLDEAILEIATDICVDKLDSRNQASIDACVGVSTVEGLAQYGWEPLDDPAPEAPPCLVPFFRLYNPSSGDHFNTTDIGEVNSAGAAGYRFEGVSAYVARDQLPGTTPFFRLYNGQKGDHFNTTDPNEVASAATVGWHSEGVGAFVASEQLPDTVPFFRLFNGSNGDHFATTDSNESATAQANGYVSEGVSAYVWPAVPKGWTLCQ